MKAVDIIELMLISLASLVFASQRERLPTEVALGHLLVFGALTLLLHGFVRDLYLLYRQKTVVNQEPKVEMRCMCLGSTLGLVVILLGVLLSLVLTDLSVVYSPLGWSVSFTSILLFGFLTKEVIITWRPFSIRKEPNHVNIIFKL